MIELSKITDGLVCRIKSVAEKQEHMNHHEMNFAIEEYANEYGKAWGSAVAMAAANGFDRVTLESVEIHEVVPGMIPKVRWWFVACSRD